MSEIKAPGGLDSRPAGSLSSDDTPSIIDAGDGLTVFHKNRFLYSRYAPQRNPSQIATSVSLRPETLVLCPSPLLGYGLDILLARLPPDCLVLGLERDQSLMALSAAHIGDPIRSHPMLRFIRADRPEQALAYLDALVAMPFRRCQRVDLSAGSSLYPEYYAKTAALIDEYISRYWRNRVTLMRLGRSFARNFFRNLPLIPTSRNLGPNMEKKPLFVAGAGPSLDASLDFVKRNRAAIFLLAVDTALAPLADSGLTPDAIVLVESQFWIERAFAGFAGSAIPIFADLTARPSAVLATGGDVRFFFSEYARSAFLSRFLAKDVGVPAIPPLGSVGLVALWLAERIAPPNAPIFASGLDFSWGKGHTHSRGAPAVREALCAATRLVPAASLTRACAPGTVRARGKSGDELLTDPSLSGYARLCASAFACRSRLFDLGETGLDTGLSRLTRDEAQEIIDRWIGDERAKEGIPNASPCEARRDIEETIRVFLEDERRRLAEIRGILSGETKIDHAAETVERLVREADYLYLHFPDGHRGYSSDPAFLRRVRIELEYFLKTIERALADSR